MRRTGLILAVATLVIALSACTAPPSSAPTPGVGGTSPASATAEPLPPGPAGYVDDASREAITPGPVPSWDASSRQSAIAAAETVMAAYAQPTVPFEQWWAQLQPLLDQKATQDYAYMDPARIVASGVTGPGVLTDETSAYVAYVDVPTDAGVYSVILSRADADAPWLANRFLLPAGVN